MAGGTLNFLGDHGPFMFEMKSGPRPNNGLLPDPGVRAVSARKSDGQGLLSLGPMGLSEEEGQAGGGSSFQTDALPRDAEPVVISDSESLPDLNEPATDKGKAVVTYQRRSERIKKLQDGKRVGSVERASLRKAGNDDSSDSSLGAFSTPRRKSRKLPEIMDISLVAPLPITEHPEETSRQKLMELASCCGLLNVDQLLNMSGKDALMNMDLMLKLKEKEKEKSKGKEKTSETDGSHG